MRAKTMEGLVGARTNINMVDVPIRVFKEARRRGDTATMERAMGYASEFAGRAEEYKAKADEGMEEDAEEAREKEELEREKAIEKRKEEREEMQARIEEGKAEKIDTVEVSEEGKILLEVSISSDTADSMEKRTDTDKKPVIYTKTGEVSQTGQSSHTSIFWA